MKCLLRWGAWLLVLLFLIPSVLGQTLNTTIYSDPSKDGWVDTFVCSSGDDINALSSLRVGQGSVSVTSNYRSFVSFDVSSLKGVGITSATLFVYQSSVVDSPYTNGGNIVVDLVDYGPTLDVQDWCESATASDIGAISSNATLGFKSLNVTSSLASVLGQGNDLLQFRFQSQDENSFSLSGYAVFEAGEAQSSGLAPRLEVTYTVANSRPVVNAGPDQTVESGSSVVISGSGSDPDGDTLTFSWSQLQGPQLALVGIDTPTLSFTAPNVTNTTTFSFRLEVSDGSLASTDEVTVMVVPGESSNLIFPQFVNGQAPLAGQVAAGVGETASRTRIILRNNSDLTDTGRIDFRDAIGIQTEVPINGIPTHTFLYLVEGWKTLEVETDGTGVLQSGVIEVVSDLGPQSKLEGTEVFEVLGNFVSVNNAPPLTRQQTYVSVTADENTGIALHNPHRTFATVDLILVSGEEQARKQVIVGPSRQLVAFLDEEEFFRDFFQSVNGMFKGTLNVHATGKGVSMLGLIQKRATGALIGVSASPTTFTPSN